MNYPVATQNTSRRQAHKEAVGSKTRSAVTALYSALKELMDDGDVASARSKIAAILAGNATLANGDPAVSIIGLLGAVAHFNNQKISHAERLASVDSFISGIRGLLAAK